MKKGNPKRDLFRGSASNAMMAFALAARSKTVALVVLVVHRPSSIHLVCKANSSLNPKAHLSPPLFLPLARSIRSLSPCISPPPSLSPFPLSLPMFPNALSPLPLPCLSLPDGRHLRSLRRVVVEGAAESRQRRRRKRRRHRVVVVRRRLPSFPARSLARAPSVPLAIPPLPNERGRDPGCRPRGCTESERVSQ